MPKFHFIKISSFSFHSVYGHKHSYSQLSSPKSGATILLISPDLRSQKSDVALLYKHILRVVWCVWLKWLILKVWLDESFERNSTYFSTVRPNSDATSIKITLQYLSAHSLHNLLETYENQKKSML